MTHQTDHAEHKLNDGLGLHTLVTFDI